MTNIEPRNLESQETLQQFMAEKQQNNNFAFLAMLDEKGNYYSADGCYPAAEVIESAQALLDGQPKCMEWDAR